MKSVFKRVLGLFLAVLTVFSGLVFVAPEKASAATDDWIYSSTLPSTVTNEKYYIEYQTSVRNTCGECHNGKDDGHSTTQATPRHENFVVYSHFAVWQQGNEYTQRA